MNEHRAIIVHGWESHPDDGWFPLILPHHGHFAQADGYTEPPAVLEGLEKFIGSS